MKFELHTGVVMANTFQEMLELFGLQDKVKQIIYCIYLSSTKLGP